jgi:hypothetical protein
MASSGCGNQPYRIRVGSQPDAPSSPERAYSDRHAPAARLGVAAALGQMDPEECMISGLLTPRAREQESTEPPTMVDSLSRRELLSGLAASGVVSTIHPEGNAGLAAPDAKRRAYIQLRDRDRNAQTWLGS